MHHRWWHGAVIALLYPELLKEFTLPGWNEEGDREEQPLIMPDEVEDLNVFDFQKFEHHVHQQLPLIRVCPTRMMGPPSVDLPEVTCTPQQVEALRLCILAMGLKQNDLVNTEYQDMTVKKCLAVASRVKNHG